MEKTHTSPEPPRSEPLPSQAEQTAPPAATPRKQPMDSSSSHHEPRPKRARLTRKNLAAFDKTGRKKTSDPTDDSGSTRTTSTTSSGFAEKARTNGMLPPTDSKPPTNLVAVRERHARSRATASPPESAYEDYASRIEEAGNEATVVIKTSELLKKYPKGYSQAYSRAFTNLPKDVGFNNGLSAPQPDFVEGLKIGEYRPFPVDQHMPRATLYKDDAYSITLPQIAGEWKGPTGDIREARMQSAYDGAAMVHARAQALAYMGQSDPASHTEITTFTTDGAILNLYAHYAAPADEDPDTLEYHQFPISSVSLTGTYQGYKDGRKQLRNAQDHAKTQSEALRDQLKEYWKQHRDNLLAISEGAPLPVPPTSTDNHDDATDEGEDEDDYEIVDPHCRSTPAASSQPHKSRSQSRSSAKPHSRSSESHSTESSHSHKRKTSSSKSSHRSSGHVSKHRSYWKKEPVTGRYYRRHSDGTKSWLDDGDEEEEYSR